MLLSHYMTLLFWFRKNVRALHRPGTLYCRVTVDKVEFNFATAVRVHKDEWDATRQQVRGRGDAARVGNQQLTQLADGLREAFNLLEKEGTYITPARVVDRYQHPQARVVSLLEAAGRFLAYRDTQVSSNQITASTREADGVRLARLEEWLTDTKRLEMRPAEFSSRKAEQFLDYLLAKPRSRNYSLKVLDTVRALLKWCVRVELLDRNPMEGFEAAKEKPGPPVFLTPSELIKLWYYEFHTQALRKVADLFLFQCFTGLAWQDMVNFRGSEHLVPQPNGSVLLRLPRQKTDVLTMIPLFRPAFDILAKYGGEQLPVPSNVYLNRTLKQVAYLVGLTQHITTHVGRKTAGMVLLQDGVPMTIVSRVLGHSSVGMTEKYYSQVLPGTVLNEMAKIYGAETMGISQVTKPFLREFTERLLAA